MTEEKEYFINLQNFGDDLAEYLIRELQAQRVEVNADIGQEDHGWYFSFRCAGKYYNLIVGHQDGEDENWLGWLENDVGFLPSLFGGRSRKIQPQAAQLVHRMLISSPRIKNVRWHFKKDYESGNELFAAEEPTPV
ncbi:MAG: hypothetical protein ACRYFS_00385 [Janthinobacterium lividum]